MQSLISFLILILVTASVHAEPISIRWTAHEDKNSEFTHLIENLNQRSGFQLSASDFLLIEDRELANNHFKMFIQAANGIPIKQHSLRIWTDIKTGQLIQFEARVENDSKTKMYMSQTLQAWPAFSLDNPIQNRNQLNQRAAQIIQKHIDDPMIRDLSATDNWENSRLVHTVIAKAKHGVHEIKFDFDSMRMISQTYKSFPDADADEFSIPALVYPIYEETPTRVVQNRVITQLKYLRKKIKASNTDPYSVLQIRHYISNLQDPILGLTLEGQADGYWAMSEVKTKAAQIFSQLPDIENSFSRGVILEGRYATINIHPDAIEEFKGIQFTPLRSAVFKPSWGPVSNSDAGAWEMIPGGSFLGKALTSFEEAFQRPARRLPDHNPVEYINDGFDEVQVYFAINTLMDSLHQIGFTDPELSTRPFHAFLYDPDINSRDNAYYTDDTINFATYSSEAQNYARDNSTIWHELGHGIMDRLMGDSVQLADTGGLSEGMADFVAALVIEKITKGQSFEGSEDFRIVNQIGFSLTNEVHDDGESYGGSMRDLLTLAKNKYGVNGVAKVGDLTMETMRLCRNNPAITAEVWFEHMLFADELGHSPIRASGELKDLIQQALAHRNFTFDGQNRAQFKIIYNHSEIGSSGPASRENPIRLNLAAGEKANYTLQVTATDGEAYKYTYPMRVRVQLRQGPLQGALKWDGEETTYVDYTLNNSGDSIDVNLSISSECEYVNRQDGSCVDFAYIQLWPEGAKSPVAKKRFYLRLMPKP